ncbi:hypothetical protein NPIL_97561 [Nephila pilipes]|uniref:Uncharacterized protein n=1 Tax=Nephila pilipes TaxID=299642 RepID=A0A8X6MQR4_NEPPI|nr:hypothetical protein NPIL_97561 [Nephila pilipes]
MAGGHDGTYQRLLRCSHYQIQRRPGQKNLPLISDHFNRGVKFQKSLRDLGIEKENSFQPNSDLRRRFPLLIKTGSSTIQSPLPTHEKTDPISLATYPVPPVASNFRVHS